MCQRRKRKKKCLLFLLRLETTPLKSGERYFGAGLPGTANPPRYDRIRSVRTEYTYRAPALSTYRIRKAKEMLGAHAPPSWPRDRWRGAQGAEPIGPAALS